MQILNALQNFIELGVKSENVLKKGSTTLV
jgi:hypothetical protein